MRVLLAHALTPKRRRLARVLRAAGHEVVRGRRPGEALARCRAWAPDVALIHVECCGDLVCDIKADPVAYATAIIMIERPGLDARRQALDGHAPRRPGLPGRAGGRRRGAHARRGRGAHQGAPAGARRPGRAAGGAAARGRAHRALEPARDPDPAGRAWSPPPAATGTRSRSRSRPRPLQAHQRHATATRPATRCWSPPRTRWARTCARRTSSGASAARSSSSCCPTPTPTPPARGRAAARRGRRRARRPCRVTVSIGLATWDGEAPEELLHRADEALYAAKDAGRDRVMAATLHGRT